MRLLEPHVLSERLKKLAEQKNQLDTAVAMLKNAPLAAQNTAVWNTLIWECMKARRFKLAYELFVDVCSFVLFHAASYLTNLDETERLQSDHTDIPNHV
jgi:hypothetical protein